MTITNATRKLTKAGFTVSETYPCAFQATKENFRDVIEFRRNGGGSENVVCIRVRRTNDLDDSMSDYSAGCFVNTITRAMKIARA
jgi:hypothetical protein